MARLWENTLLVVPEFDAAEESSQESKTISVRHSQAAFSEQ